MKMWFLTLFPQVVEPYFAHSILGRAREAGVLETEAVQIRDFAGNKHGKVDDYPYGGGAGMLMQAQPIYAAYASLPSGQNRRVIYASPQGRRFDQKLARELARSEELVFVCGHYEGVDERLIEEIVTDCISMGDFVLTGGELPCMAIADAVSRLLPGVLGNGESAKGESFHLDLLEYPQYTRPPVWRGRVVPESLLGGNHRQVEQWRRQQAEERTKSRRPDLYAVYQDRQRQIRRLEKEKRENIHIIESLRRGEGDILYQGRGLLVWSEAAGIAMVQGDAGEAWALMAHMPQDLRYVVAPMGELQETLAAGMGLEFMSCCRQALYTQKTPLRVRHKDIRPLERGDLPRAARWYAHEELSYLEGRLAAGCLYGWYGPEGLGGMVGRHDDGAMGMLYVAEAYRRQGLAASLEAFMVNRELEQGHLPYAHIFSDNSASLALQEKLGLYLSKGEIVWMRKP